MPSDFLNLASTLGAISKDLGGVDGSQGASSTTPHKETKKPKTKRVLDPDAPKKPTTSYFSFASEERKIVRDERERKGLQSLGNNEMTLEIASRWNALSDQEKEPWNALYKEQMAKYNEAKQIYQEQKKAAAANAPAETSGDAATAVVAPAATATPVKKSRARKQPPVTSSPIKPAPVEEKEAEESDEIESEEEAEEQVEAESESQEEEEEEDEVMADALEEEEEEEDDEPVMVAPPSTQPSRKSKQVAASAVETPTKVHKRPRGKENVLESAPSSGKKDKKDKKDKKRRKSSAIF